MTLSTQSAERLEQVIRVLEELPKGKKFKLDTWMKCGTAGCAIGWAAVDPWFQRRGLKLDKCLALPQYKDLHLWFAIEAFFSLDPDDAVHLFSQLEYGKDRSRRAVCRRIRKFIKDNTGAVA